MADLVDVKAAIQEMAGQMYRMKKTIKAQKEALQRFDSELAGFGTTYADEINTIETVYTGANESETQVISDFNIMKGNFSVFRTSLSELIAEIDARGLG